MMLILLSGLASGCAKIETWLLGPMPALEVTEFCDVAKKLEPKETTVDWLEENDPVFQRDWLFINEYGRVRCNWKP